MTANITMMTAHFEHSTGLHEVDLWPSGLFQINLYRGSTKYNHLSKRYYRKAVRRLDGTKTSDFEIEVHLEIPWNIVGLLKPAPVKLTFPQMVEVAENLIQNICDSLTQV